MMTEKKKVNIYPFSPILTVNPPIRVPVMGVSKNLHDIRTCILAGARVEEILDSGKIIKLNLKNYNLDNNGSINKKPEPKLAPAKESNIKQNPMQIPEKKLPEPIPVKKLEPVKEEAASVLSIPAKEDPEDKTINLKEETITVKQVTPNHEELETMSVDELLGEDNSNTQQHLSKKQQKKLLRQQMQNKAFEKASDTVVDPESM